MTSLRPDLPVPGPAVLPAGLSQAFGFAVFNALSFLLVLGSPMVLYIIRQNMVTATLDAE